MITPIKNTKKCPECGKYMDLHDLEDERDAFNDETLEDHYHCPTCNHLEKYERKE